MSLIAKLLSPRGQLWTFSVVSILICGYGLCWNLVQKPGTGEGVVDTRANSKAHAHAIAAIYQSAKASGAEVEGESVDEILETLQMGVQGYGRYAKSVYRVQLDTPEEVQAVKEHLQVEKSNSGNWLSVRE